MTNDKQRISLVQRQGSHQGKRYTLKNALISIGSDKGSDIVVNGSFVSPKHASISRRDDGLWMVSNLSVNRTLVNQQEIDTQQLVSGDMIQIGAETLFEFEVINKNAKKVRKKPTVKEAKPVSRRPLIQIALVVYLLLIVVAGFVIKSMNSSNNDIALSMEEVEVILADSRDYFRSDEFIRATVIAPVSDAMSDTEDAAQYFKLVSQLKSGDTPLPASDIDPLLDELLNSSREQLYRAWKYERQLRWAEAITEYRGILASIPDIRIPLVSFVMKRISLLQEKIE